MSKQLVSGLSGACGALWTDPLRRAPRPLLVVPEELDGVSDICQWLFIIADDDAGVCGRCSLAATSQSLLFVVLFSTLYFFPRSLRFKRSCRSLFIGSLNLCYSLFPPLALFDSGDF
uniref:Uncharacterized protein n=1 Tax=Plectus sambesii TaxID=2011161 RepID=A0A914W847_9BILA